MIFSLNRTSFLVSAGVEVVEKVFDDLQERGDWFGLGRRKA